MKNVITVVSFFNFIFATCFAQQNLGGAQLAAKKYQIEVVKTGTTTETSNKFKEICDPTFKIMFCIWAASTAVQAISDGNSARKSHKTLKEIECQGGICNGGAVGIDTDGDNIPDQFVPSEPNPDALARERILNNLDQQNNSNLKDLASKGFRPNKDGSITGPNGKNYSGDTSLQAMKDAGLNADQIAEAQAVLKDAQKDAKNKFAELAKQLGNNMADAGASQTIRNKKYIDNGTGFDPNSLLRGFGGRGPASAEPFAGLSKNVGQDSIGVSGDNIFKMINRQYDHQRTKGSFLFK